MFKSMMVLLFALFSGIVSAQETAPNLVGCELRAQIYARVIQARDNQVMDLDTMVSSLGDYLTSNAVPIEEVNEVVLEAKKVYEDASLTRLKALVKYLNVCVAEEAAAKK